MHTSNLLSIIIPVYNEEQVIADCIASLLKQNYKEKEIILVDDGSTDNTVQIIRQFEGVQLLKQQHKGPAQARNLGAKTASGKILVFVDSDMTFERDFLDKLTTPIFVKDVKGTFSNEEYIENWDNVWSRCWNFNRNFAYKKMHSENQSDYGTDFRAILSSEFKRVGGFSDTGYTDSWTLFQKLGYRPRAAKGAIFYHKNPADLGEVFIQSKWMSKRPYKLGIFGDMIALVRIS